MKRERSPNADFALSPQKMLELQRQSTDQISSFCGRNISFAPMDPNPRKPMNRNMLPPQMDLYPQLGHGYPNYRPNVGHHLSMPPVAPQYNNAYMVPSEQYMYAMTPDLYSQQQQHLLMSMHSVQHPKNVPKTSLRIPAPHTALQDSQFASYMNSGIMGLKPSLNLSKDAGLFNLPANMMMNAQGFLKKQPKFDKAERAKVLARYREKRKRRDFRRVRYKLRKKIAHGRPRVGGRFVKKSELAAAESSDTKKSTEKLASP